jgi:hypothetical protein
MACPLGGWADGLARAESSSPSTFWLSSINSCWSRSLSAFRKLAVVALQGAIVLDNC